MDPSEYSTTRLFLNVVFMLFFVVVGVWFLTRNSEEANRIVRLRGEWGYPVTDHAGTVAKYRRRVRIFYSCFVVLGILGALLFGYGLVRRLWQ